MNKDNEQKTYTMVIHLINDRSLVFVNMKKTEVDDICNGLSTHQWIWTQNECSSSSKTISTHINLRNIMYIEVQEQ